MTIQYTSQVVTAGGMPSPFVKLLRRWRGSIYKLIYADLFIFLGSYYLLNLSYRFIMTPDQQEQFADVVSYFSQYNTQIPITFVLGFYVSIVIGRWTNQIYKKPWPDPVATFVSSLIRGNDERGRKMRRTIMRYVSLSYIMVFRLMSPKVKKRFPTYDHLIDAGVLVENEKKIISAMDEIYPKLPKYWMPIVWASSILTRARHEGRIRDDFALRTLNDSLNSFRQSCIMLLHHDTISIPLVYTQVVTLAVYSYFFAAVIGNQWIRVDKNFDYKYTIDYYFPLFTTLEFFFFMGWLKVAETLICPFGEDDDDFEINACIDGNIMRSYVIVDEMHNRHPQLIKDQYWDEVYPYELPGGGADPPEHSTVHLEPKQSSLIPSEQELIKEQESTTNILWKRASKSPNDVFPTKRFSTDSDEHSFNEKFVQKHVHSIQSEDLSQRLLDEYSEEDEQDEEAEEEIIEGMTFERLREERERERLERQHLKVQRTVENVADMAADMPRRMHRMGKFGQFEKTPTDSDEDRLKFTSEDGQTKKDEQPRSSNGPPKKDEPSKTDNEQSKKDEPAKMDDEETKKNEEPKKDDEKPKTDDEQPKNDDKRN